MNIECAIEKQKNAPLQMDLATNRNKWLNSFLYRSFKTRTRLSHLQIKEWPQGMAL